MKEPRRPAFRAGYCLVISTLAAAGLAAGPAELVSVEALPKSRVIVLTDMLNEPDDSQTMVRLLMYANEMDIEGLIAVSSCHQYAGKNDENPERNEVQPEAIIERIKAYGQVRDNLLLHDVGWPTVEALLAVVGAGPSGYGMWDVGDGHSTSGSELIIKALLRDDSRPLYVCINAGANTLAQALWDLEQRVENAVFQKCLGKLRVYDDAGQDNAGAWIARTYPKIHYLRSQNQVFSFMNGKGPLTWDDSLYPGEGQHLWAMEHVMTGHGPLGALYPVRKRYLRPTEWHTVEGGGTSTWIGHVNHGLYHPEQPTWGGWGGRFQVDKQENVLALQLRWADLVETEDPYKPFYMIPEAADQWTDPETGILYEGEDVPIFRWRRAYQSDFQARMDWCVKPREEANHNPVASVNGDCTDGLVRISAKPREVVRLDAADSYDPDGDCLFYRWFPYPEAGSYSGPMPDRLDSAVYDLVVENAMPGDTLHMILEVRDLSEIAPMTDYRRVIISFDGDTP